MSETVPPRVSITIPEGPLRDLLVAIRTRSSAENALAAELWGYDASDVPASKVVVDMMAMGASQLQAELDAESYHLDAQTEDPEREAWVAFTMAQFAVAFDDEASVT